MDQTRFTLRIHPLIMKKLKVIADPTAVLSTKKLNRF